MSRPRTSGARQRWSIAAVLMAGAVVALLWPRDERGPVGRERVHEPAKEHGAAAVVPGARTEPPALRAGVMGLHEALREEVVQVPSSVSVDGIDMDRAWACAGEPVQLAARVGGAEPGVVHRWVWREADGVELHPGLSMEWRAPAQAGTYAVRFQVCRDLGGRRISVLAEREVAIEVRSCAAGESQDREPVRLRAVQRRHDAFAFHALYRGEGQVEAYEWSFGDGSTASTAEPMVEHAYVTQELGPHDTRSFTATVTVRLVDGQRLDATAMALVRGRPPAEEPLAVELEIARWQPRRDGQGWESELVVQALEAGEITWDRLERTTRYFDGREEIATREWTEVIRVDETLELGGFRGAVLVDASEVPPDVKQIIDMLYGHDAAGNEVMTSWSSFKREPAPTEGPGEPLQGK